ncbi:crotonobetainyl-CoA:carnitine CoA-transferase CaiB-like acyl-CoA transferase [Angulomicrobium tetraedrale]|uniref:Crotonobetainyl-CoA:carnitine CoA-transferase CaiB-like acyl-CoA transferase n=1 Tax=Ancylobacter tetraedralis TaxID=217068 RepID=A0A839Z7Q8_9HYPH|nr:CoA transferase [Ancylobacter tetraedralis]MBB3771171.1 crotonobetainyl-CoA:carnitine CoA-transferase CaiB-like acyl-CoA transferase [Ancylobacter tetraedralis]
MTVGALKGLKVIEFSQMIMGPCTGLILADLGADVVKVEPVKGDRTRYLPGLAAGFFDTFSRNKRSIALDMKSEEGMDIVRKLVSDCDVVIENFRPGMMADLGLGYDDLREFNPGLIYCSLKGFLPGPYEHRTALDEVVQMMGGLAYMTGLPGRPLRTGASVNDIMGAMFGVIGIQNALLERRRTGNGQQVQSSLFENTAFLMAPAMLAEVITGEPATPFAITERPWPAYDLFDLADGSKLFVGIVGDEQWRAFCQAFGFEAWLSDPDFATNHLRQKARSRILPAIREAFLSRDAADVASTVERIGLPFAPLRTPIDLLDDVHLNESGAMIPMQLQSGIASKLPALPLILDGQRLTGTTPAPTVGEHSRDVLRALHFDEAAIEALLSSGKVAAPALAGQRTTEGAR